MNPLRQLAEHQQSVWYDNVSRDLLVSGEIARLIDQDNVTGLTSNPTIFEKAIAKSNHYDSALRRLADAGLSTDDIYERLAVEDIQQVADHLKPVWDRTSAADGFASLEVSPLLAHKTDETVAEAKRLWAALNRPNVMIKVPATPAGLPAITALIGQGINVNVTLMFDVDNYADVAHAYIAGLEQARAAGHDLSRIASVASFFVSRVDTAVDRQLDGLIANTADARRQTALRGLLGQAAIANAKIAYARFGDIFGSARFASLQAAGARVQRPLWASTGVKNPNYRDVMYVEDLIGPHTVNTMPPQLIDAFRDHGVVNRTVDVDVDVAREVWAAIAGSGVDLKAVTAQLQVEGVKSFADSFVALIDAVEQKRAAVMV